MGEVVWVGRGALGRDDGRIVLFRPGREGAPRAGRSAPRDAEPPAGRATRRSARWLGRRGASFYRELHAAAGGGSDREVLDALWDLVWAGEVTNDTFAPLRALRWRRPSRDPRRRPGRLRASGRRRPRAAGRSVATADAAPGSDATRGRSPPRERLHAWSLALLERHGVLTREAVAAEGLSGGFPAVYPVLRAMEEAGRIRRGYFVDGLGAAQFALPGAVDRLRAAARARGRGSGRARARRDRPGEPVRRRAAVAAARRRRPAAAGPRARAPYVASVDGEAALYVERGGSAFQTLPAVDDPAIGRRWRSGRWAPSSPTAGSASSSSPASTARPIGESPWRERFIAAGFVPGYRGLVLRGRRRGSPSARAGAGRSMAAATAAPRMARDAAERSPASTRCAPRSRGGAVREPRGASRRMRIADERAADA